MQFIHESIFLSATRAFFKAFFVIIGIFVAFIPIILVFNLISKDTASDVDKYKVSILPDLSLNQTTVSSSAPAILKINIHGIIGKKGLTTNDMYQLLVESRRGVLKDNRVKGILLHINSPGGSSIDSDGIYRLISSYKEAFKIPVYTYVDGLCASGGMYIAASSDKIYTSPPSIIGSVGVLIGPLFNVYEALNKIGVTSLTLTQGKGKDALSPFKKWENGEDESLKNIGNYLYERFVSIVETARPMMDKDKLKNEYGANVFDSQKAQEYGYIDNGNSSYSEALRDLLVKANVDINKPYQIVEMSAKQDWLCFFENKTSLLSGNIKHTFQIGSYDLSEIKDPFAYLYLP